MPNVNGGNAIPPEADRRRTERIPCEPLRVRVNVRREGILVDLSQGGALVQLPTAPPPEHAQVTLAIALKDRTLHFSARVVRSIPHRVQGESTTPERTEYRLALEFLELRADTAAALRQIIQAQRGRASQESDTPTTRHPRR
jgi:c-di-GMP-binding flagellar brake protein YcgR